MSKGIAWTPIAIGVIFLAEILVFSLAFSQVTFFSREVFDANVVFEGDELETYTRSIENSVQLSIAQGVYDFYEKENGNPWQGFSVDEKPPDTQIVEDELNANVKKYQIQFFEAHQDFAIKQKNGINLDFPEDSSLEVKSDKIYVKFTPEIVLTKDFQDDVSYTRKFVAEAEFVTVFGEIMNSVRSMINDDLVGSYVVEGIGKPQSGPSKSECSVLDRNGDTELHSYIDEDVSLPEGNKPFATLSKHIDGSQTQTQGTVRFCNLDKTVQKGCFCNDPCGNGGSGLPRMGEPAPNVVYSMTHTQSFGSGTGKIENYAEKRLLCLEAELDQESERYTVAFDGDNRGLGLGDSTIITESEIIGSCDLNNEGTECRGIRGSVCGSCPLPGGGETPKHDWKCPLVHTKSCDFDHYGTGSMTIRYQEDGFVYGFDRSGQEVADNIKVVFGAESGHKKQ